MSKDEIGQLAEAHQVMLSGITSVISRLQQVNQNLKLSEERWQLALEGSSDGLWDWDISRSCLSIMPGPASIEPGADGQAAPAAALPASSHAGGPQTAFLAHSPPSQRKVSFAAG